MPLRAGRGFRGVDIGKVLDYWRAIRGVLLEIKNVDIPEVRPASTPV